MFYRTSITGICTLALGIALMAGCSSSPTAPAEPTPTPGATQFTVKSTFDQSRGTIKRSPGLPAYDSGTTIVITTLPQTAWEVHSFTVNGTSHSSPCTLKVESNISINVRFRASAPVLAASVVSSAGVFTLDWTFAGFQTETVGDQYIVMESRTGSARSFAPIKTVKRTKGTVGSLPKFLELTRDSGSYFYQVIANEVGEFGPTDPSNMVKATVKGPAPTVPAAPSGLYVSNFGPDLVELKWTDNAADENGFEMFRSTSGGVFAKIATLAANTAFWTDRSVAASTDYVYKIHAVNGAGSSDASNLAGVSVPAATSAPAKPGRPYIVAMSSDSVRIGWSDRSSNEDNFRVTRTHGGQVINTLLSANATRWTDKNVSSSSMYSYVVTAVNAHGSATSDQLNLNTPAPPTIPLPPSNLSMTGLEADAITLNWNDNSNNETGFRLLRRTGTSTNETAIEVPANTTTWTDRLVMPLTTYSYRMVALNSAGTSTRSNVVSGKTPELTGPPNAPANLRILNTDQGAITLRWTDLSSNEDEMRLYRRIKQPGAVANVTRLPADRIQHIDSTVIVGMTYEYWVRAVNSDGLSPLSNVVSITAPNPSFQPQAPTNLQATYNGSQAVLTWQDNSDNEQYFQIEVALSADFFGAGKIEVNENVTQTPLTVIPDKTYYFRLRAINPFGKSAYTNTVELLTRNTTSTGTLKIVNLLNGPGSNRVLRLRIGANDNDVVNNQNTEVLEDELYCFPLPGTDIPPGTFMTVPVSNIGAYYTVHIGLGLWHQDSPDCFNGFAKKMYTANTETGFNNWYIHTQFPIGQHNTGELVVSIEYDANQNIVAKIGNDTVPFVVSVNQDPINW